MICIKSQNNDPFFNLAAEEYFLKNSDEEVFMIWISEPSVIVGKHQNTCAEINYPFVKENKIKVARRLTGGGAVFHDEGNINFTFIRNGEEGKLINFRKFMDPVIDILNQYGVPAVFGEKNDILADGLKISGNAEHVYKKRVLHHGTLLFNSHLDHLNEVLRVIPGKYRDKAVQSKRSRVTNIARYLKNEDINAFTGHLIRILLESNPGSTVYHPEITGMKAIERLIQERYSTWEWIYGYSPDYFFTNRFEIGGKICEIGFEVKKGVLNHVGIEGNLFTTEERQKLYDGLSGLYHREQDITRALLSSGIKKFNPFDLKTLVYGFF